MKPLSKVWPQGLSTAVCQALELYEHELAQWNQKFNLVSRASLAAARERHFLDSLQVAPWFFQQLHTSSRRLNARPSEVHQLETVLADKGSDLQLQSEGLKAYDIGSGAGFPGLVLAIYAQHQCAQHNEAALKMDVQLKQQLKTEVSLQGASIEALQVQWCLVEAHQKKASFLQHMVDTLKLCYVQVLNQRLESLPPQSIDWALSRGVAIKDVLKNIKNPARKSCRVVFMKGPQAAHELVQLPNKIKQTWQFKQQQLKDGLSWDQNFGMDQDCDLDPCLDAGQRYVVVATHKLYKPF